MSARQQGDCRFLKVNAIPKTAKIREKKNGWNILALGESTGHKHQIVEDDVDVYEDTDGTLYLKSDAMISVVHEEHRKQTLEPGIQRMKIVREKDHINDLVRNVRD